MLYLIRGLPGAGKSTFGALLGKVISADDFFMVDGEYRFVPSKLSAAHTDCQMRTKNELHNGTVVVANTFTQRWEMEPYIQMANNLGVEIVILDVFDGACTNEELFARNVHGVPLASIQAMRQRYERDWENGDTRPPWARK